MTRQKMVTRATIGLGSLLGAIIAAPASVAVLAPVFKQVDELLDRHRPGDALPGGRAWPASLAHRHLRASAHDTSGLARRLVYIRNDGDQQFTAISNTCMHVGCPVQANATGFACPCHGGQYDSEGRRTAGPPVRPLNRYETSVDDRGHLILGQLYALDNTMRRHQLKGPGEPVDGPLSDLYPEVPQG